MTNGIGTESAIKIEQKNYIHTNKTMMRIQSILNTKPSEDSQRVNILTIPNWINPGKDSFLGQKFTVSVCYNPVNQNVEIWIIPQKSEEVIKMPLC